LQNTPHTGYLLINQSIKAIKNMNWSNWAISQKQGSTEVQTLEKLGGISSGCFWRMVAKNIAPNDRNLNKMASAKGATKGSP
jgi:hypothetical protein